MPELVSEGGERGLKRPSSDWEVGCGSLCVARVRLGEKGKRKAAGEERGGQ